APGAVRLNEVPPVAVLLEHRCRLAEGLVGAVLVAGEREALRERPERVAPLERELVAGGVQRRLRPLGGLFAVAEEHRSPGLVATEIDQIFLLRARSEQAPGAIEVRAGRLRTALRHEDVSAEQVRPREVEAVV